MLKSDLLRLLQQEIRRHGFDYFIDEPPSIAQGGKGVVVPGCPACRKPEGNLQMGLCSLRVIME